jgi:hypothetical protein
VLGVSSLIFFGLAMIPWHEYKNGERLPLGAAYVNNMYGWEILLLLVPHIIISIILGSFVVYAVKKVSKDI